MNGIIAQYWPIIPGGIYQVLHEPITGVDRFNVLSICHAWQRRPPFPVNLCDLASLRLEGMQAKYSGRCTPLEYLLLDWHGPFGSSLPSHW